MVIPAFNGTSRQKNLGLAPTHPGPRRNISPPPSENKNLNPPKIQEALLPQSTGKQPLKSPGSRTVVENKTYPPGTKAKSPTLPLENSKLNQRNFTERSHTPESTLGPLPSDLGRTEKLSIAYRPKDGMPFTKEEYARKDLKFL
ncbi:uncharacterized protein PGTG_20428, partial [Puccinia graminis f. sp. tritici CRL 75-36-700-3]